MRRRGVLRRASARVRRQCPKVRLEGCDFLGEQGDFLLLAYEFSIQGLQRLILKGKTGFEFNQAVFHAAPLKVMIFCRKGAKVQRKTLDAG